VLGTSFITSFFSNAYQWYQRCTHSLFILIRYEAEFNLMLEQLAVRRALPVEQSTSLKSRISQTDLNKILDYFLIDGRENKAIAALLPGEAYRVDKRRTGLPRTVTMLRRETGEFDFLLETKSKLANNQKDYSEKKGGGSKNGKPAFKINGSTVAYFNLVVSNMDAQKDLKRINKEVKLSQYFDSKYIQRNILGPCFNREMGNDKINIYSPRASYGDLFCYLKKYQSQLTALYKAHMVLDLLLGIKVLHDKDYAHQDLKPGNILVNENNLSLTDLGSLEKHESKKEVLTTFEYLSPELAAGVRDKSIFNKIMCYGHMKNNYGDNVPSAFLLPHKANDMWAFSFIPSFHE